jgi:hypothetical protein
LEKILQGNMFRVVDGKYGFMPDSAGVAGWKYKGLGRLIGLMVVSGIPLGIELIDPILKILLGLRGGGNRGRWVLDDVDDAVMHQSFQAILQCKEDGNCEDFELFFETTDGLDLKQATGGERSVKSRVSESNVEEYITLTVRYEMYEKYRGAYSEFVSGFRDVIGMNVFEGLFDVGKFGEFLRGNLYIDTTQLQKRVIWRGENFGDLPGWFWEWLEEGGSKRRMDFVHFATGLKAIPMGGIPQITIIGTRYDSRTNNLPRAHLCSSMMELPVYPSKEEMAGKLTEAFAQTGLGIV